MARRSSAETTAASKPADAREPARHKCPECGKTFKSAAGLGAHRQRTHGVAGSSRTRNGNTATATAQRSEPSKPVAATGPRRSSRQQPVEQPTAANHHDDLLQTLFPRGVPPKRKVIDALPAWLAEADRLAGLR